MIENDRLKKLLRYEPDKGVFICRNTNEEARTSKHPDGYLFIRVDGTQYLVHRLAWFYTYGTWPEKQIDHRDGIKDNNKIDNLRDVSGSVNQQNMSKPRANNKSGFLGVSRWYTKWQATITTNGKKIHLGVYECPKKASEAYLSAKRNLRMGVV